MSRETRAALRYGSIILIWAAGAYAASVDRPPVSQSPPLPLETLDQPPAAARVHETSPSLPRAWLTRSNFRSVQVNVDALGQNIVGDAANESSITVDPAHPYRMVIGWRQFDSVSSNFREGGWAYSSDAGHTWTFPGVLENNVFRSDPVLDADANGNIYYFSLKSNFTCDMFKSLDGGKTWLPKVPAFGGDKNWMVIDRTGGVGNGNLYGSWSTAAGPYTATPFTRSTTGGASFDGPYSFGTTVPVFGTLTVGPDGTVYVAGIDFPSFSDANFLVARSANAQNGGVPTFTTTPVNMGGALIGGVSPNPEGLLGQVWIASDHSGGPTNDYLYMLCSVNPLGADPLDIHFVRSTNGGLTWSAPVQINDDPAGTNAFQWFGTMSVAPNGRIDVIWNDTRHDATPSNPTFSELFYSYSTDAGVTWSPNAAVSPAFNHFLGYPQQQKIGDYYTMVSDNVGASAAYAATFNGEQDVYYLRIGDDDCNGNGAGDSVDIATSASTDLNDDGIPDECEALGDVNCDGSPNFRDINPFVLALSNPSAYQQAYPDCPLRNRDINGDGSFDFRDINPFVALLSH